MSYSWRMISLIIACLLATQVPHVVASNTQLQACGDRWKAAVTSNESWATDYLYHGFVRGLKAGQEAPLLITNAGCNKLCGTSYQLYSWSTVSDTMTTWILPLAGGLLLQAPFESNQRLSTIFVICRWLGSPIACLMAMFWNIKITGRCALLVDMCVPIDQAGSSANRSFGATMKEFGEKLRVNFTLDPPPLEPPNRHYPQDSLSQFRDSLYILSVMNQFAFNERAFRPGDTEPIKRLLQYALFSSNTSLGSRVNRRSDRQTTPPPPSRSISPRPKKTSANLTVHHNLSPQPSETTLALRNSQDGYDGLEIPNAPLVERREHLASTIRKTRKHGVVQVLVSMLWFIVALAISIYKAFGDLGDNTTAHNLALGLLMGWVPVLISTSLVDRNPTNSETVQLLLENFLKEANDDLRQSNQVTTTEEREGVQPVGGEYERNNEDSERNNEELQPTHYLKFFNGQGRKAWHYGIAHTMLSHVEDTLLANTTNTLSLREQRLLTYYEDGSIANSTVPMVQGLWRFDMIEIWQGLLAFAVVILSAVGAFMISYNEPTVGLGCRSGGYMVFGILTTSTFLLEMIGWFLETPGDMSSIRRKSRLALRLFITVIEVSNTIWIIYILLAQTVGTYNKCDCKSSIWGFGGGYTDFEVGAAVYLTRYDIRPFWIAGTIIGMLPLLTIIYIVYQWCTQSFLWSEDFDAAMRGLRRVRLWKRVFHWKHLNHLFVKWPDYAITWIFGGRVYHMVEWQR